MNFVEISGDTVGLTVGTDVEISRSGRDGTYVLRASNLNAVDVHVDSVVVD